MGLYWPRQWYRRDNPANPGNEPTACYRRLLAADYLLRSLGREVEVVRGDRPFPAGLRNLGGIHPLRPCFASHALHNGHDLFAVKRWLGHSALSTTGRYLHVVPGAPAVVSPLDALDELFSVVYVGRLEPATTARGPPDEHDPCASPQTKSQARSNSIAIGCSRGSTLTLCHRGSVQPHFIPHAAKR